MRTGFAFFRYRRSRCVAAAPPFQQQARDAVAAAAFWASI